MLELSRQNKIDEMRGLINTRIKEGANQTSAAAHELSRLALDLNALVARFVI